MIHVTYIESSCSSNDFLLTIVKFSHSTVYDIKTPLLQNMMHETACMIFSKNSMCIINFSLFFLFSPTVYCKWHRKSPNPNYNSFQSCLRFLLNSSFNLSSLRLTCWKPPKLYFIITQDAVCMIFSQNFTFPIPLYMASKVYDSSSNSSFNLSSSSSSSSLGSCC